MGRATGRETSGQSYLGSMGKIWCGSKQGKTEEMQVTGFDESTHNVPLWSDKPRHEFKRERMPWRILCPGHLGIRVGPKLVKRDEGFSLI